MENLPEILTIAEVAKLLRVSRLSLKRWEKQGRLKAIRIGRRRDRRYKKSDILQYLEKHNI